MCSRELCVNTLILPQMETIWIGLVQFLVLYTCFPGTESGNEQFIAPETYRCACSNTVLTFECTTVGFDQTLWNGTAFNCENRGNQIILLNSAFSSGGLGSRGTCGDNLVAEGTKVDGNCYTSQLNITVTSSGLNQTSIECVYSSDKVNTVGRTVLTLLLTHYPPPRRIMVIKLSSKEITFSWVSMAPECSSMASIYYLITAPNCGECPQTVSNTTVTCTNLQPTAEIRECRFSVQNVVCGVMGNPSEPAIERIGVPTISKLAVVPHFMSSNQMLHSIKGFSNSVATLPVTAFNISFLSTFGAIISSESIANPCIDPNCAVDVLFHCSSSPSINFTVSAVNIFGQGPPSNINTIGCTNEFVKVEYDPRSSILLCNFTMVDTLNSVKSCNVSYKMCEDTRTENLMNSSTSNVVTLSIRLSPGMYCFQVEATSNNFSIIVEGNWNIRTTLPVNAIIGGVISTIIVLAMITVVTATIIAYKRKKAGKTTQCQLRLHKDRQLDAEPEDRPILSWQEQFMIKKVNTSCDLQQFCADNNLKADKIFVSYGQSMSPYLRHLTDVIVQFKDDNEKALTGPSARMLGNRGPNTTVFILNRKFPANLPLTKNAQIICQNPKQKSSKTYFDVLKVNKDQHMLAFIKEELGDDAFVNGSAFYEFSDTEDLLYYKEVLHVYMSKEKLDAKVGQQICSPEVDSDIGYFYDIFGTPGLNIKPPQENSYQVFLQSTSQGSRCLKANSLLLYKTSRKKNSLKHEPINMHNIM